MTGTGVIKSIIINIKNIEVDQFHQPDRDCNLFLIQAYDKSFKNATYEQFLKEYLADRQMNSP